MSTNKPRSQVRIITPDGVTAQTTSTDSLVSLTLRTSTTEVQAVMERGHPAETSWPRLRRLVLQWLLRLTIIAGMLAL